jgi:hypothetical protein
VSGADKAKNKAQDLDGKAKEAGCGGKAPTF